MYGVVFPASGVGYILWIYIYGALLSVSRTRFAVSGVSTLLNLPISGVVVSVFGVASLMSNVVFSVFGVRLAVLAVGALLSLLMSDVDFLCLM